MCEPIDVQHPRGVQEISRKTEAEMQKQQKLQQKYQTVYVSDLSLHMVLSLKTRLMGNRLLLCYWFIVNFVAQISLQINWHCSHFLFY